MVTLECSSLISTTNCSRKYLTSFVNKTELGRGKKEWRREKERNRRMGGSEQEEDVCAQWSHTIITLGNQQKDRNHG